MWNVTGESRNVTGRSRVRNVLLGGFPISADHSLTAWKTPIRECAVELADVRLDVQARLSSIEGLLGKLVNSLPSLAHARPTSNPASPDVSSLHPTGEDVFHPRSAPGNDIKQTLPFKPPPSGLFPASLSHDAPPGRSSFGWGLREGRMISLSVEENPDLREVLQTLKESGLSKGHLEWLIAGVPGRRMADGLVELYFRDIE